MCKMCLREKTLPQQKSLGQTNTIKKWDCETEKLIVSFELSIIIAYHPSTEWQKVMFSVVCVCMSVHRRYPNHTGAWPCPLPVKGPHVKASVPGLVYRIPVPPSDMFKLVHQVACTVGKASGWHLTEMPSCSM